jgi:hypothetical protein
MASAAEDVQAADPVPEPKVLPPGGWCADVEPVDLALPDLRPAHQLADPGRESPALASSCFGKIS